MNIYEARRNQKLLLSTEKGLRRGGTIVLNNSKLAYVNYYFLSAGPGIGISRNGFDVMKKRYELCTHMEIAYLIEVVPPYLPTGMYIVEIIEID